ncbi:hypothetical protein PACTADRAFT_37213 [Pachysolen tannophilus NRRL Y-2460]|uniref:Adenylate kinase isoenzyme 6 homolog n=1 Tax=Pachysolen tannophilus NRRL Y-2460 TaxID=669874 RepID=A0A1E4U0M4_PACTA|nr:hypothetical protein PACTADRAFT_37213 [Pachysolen tannophilus NRRL Y-2460]
MSDRRLLPNILITGTPGCGKTAHARNLVDKIPELKHFQISDIAKSRNAIVGYDEARDTSVVDEDKLLDSIEADLEAGGVVIDWHCCDIFPERLIDLVIVLRCDNGILFDRLKERKYKQSKIDENLDVEIMDVIAQEAKESYVPEIVIELQSEQIENMNENVERIVTWFENWKKDHKDGVSNLLGNNESEIETETESENDESENDEST